MKAVRFLPYVPVVGLLLALAGSVGLGLAQVDPNTWFFEIDGDDGDWLEDTKQNDGTGYLPALDVNLTDGSHSSNAGSNPVGARLNLIRHVASTAKCNCPV